MRSRQRCGRRPTRHIGQWLRPPRNVVACRGQAPTGPPKSGALSTPRTLLSGSGVESRDALSIGRDTDVTSLRARVRRAGQHPQTTRDATHDWTVRCVPRSRRSPSTSGMPSIPEASDDRSYPEHHHHHNQCDPPSHTSERGGDTREPSDGNSDSDHRRTLSR